MANKPNFRRSIRYILKKYQTDFLALFETHASGDKAMQICQNLGFDNSFCVDAITVLESSDQFVHARVMIGTEIIHIISVLRLLRLVEGVVSGDI